MSRTEESRPKGQAGKKGKKPLLRTRRLALPAWGTAEDPPKEFLLLSYGANHFTMADGSRETDYLEPEDAERIVAEWERREIDLAADYEHAALAPKEKGAPASCWFGLDAKEDGLWVVDADWSKRAKGYFDAKEYAYFSPAYHVEERDDGNTYVVSFTNFALTNHPATDKQRPLIERRRGAQMEEQEYTRQARMSVEDYHGQLVGLLSDNGVEVSEEMSKSILDLLSDWMAAMMPPKEEAAASESRAEGEVPGQDEEMQAARSVLSLARSLTGKKKTPEVEGALKAMSQSNGKLEEIGQELAKLRTWKSKQEAESETKARASLVEDGIRSFQIAPDQKSRDYWMKQPSAQIRAALEVLPKLPPGEKAVEAPAADPASGSPESISVSLPEVSKEIARHIGLTDEEMAAGRERLRKAGRI